VVEVTSMGGSGMRDALSAADATRGSAPLGLCADGVSVVYRPHRRPPVEAVTEVSLSLAPGEVLGIVGESGSGKSSLARVLAGLLTPSDGKVATVDGTGHDVEQIGSQGRGFHDVQLIMQDSIDALDPRLVVWKSVAEALSAGRSVGTRWRTPACELLGRVSITEEQSGRLPSELSGGQKQRVSIARALGAGASVLICDEIVSALDVLVRARILNLLHDLRIDFGLAMIFVSHDLAVVAHFADRVAVMRSGRIVEQGATAEVLRAPRTAYTRMLVESVPSFELDGA
jgi:ABC-type glutathione transport system ATPase component